MSRAALLQPIIDLFDNTRYLEIGVFRGDTFLSVKASEKIGVDVHFDFDTSLVDERNGAQLVKLPSDGFFSQHPASNLRFDVVFIDGLHEYNQTLRDLLNVITRLNPGSVVIVDDIVPSSYAASISDPELVWMVKDAIGSTEAAWMGDVYKIPFFVRSFLPQFNYATVEGGRELIMWHEPRQDYVRETTEWVSRRDFSDTIKHRDAYNFQPIDQIMESIRQFHSTLNSRAPSTST